MRDLTAVAHGKGGVYVVHWSRYTVTTLGNRYVFCQQIGCKLCESNFPSFIRVVLC